jgi:polysaccharide export outer membrane protein
MKYVLFCFGFLRQTILVSFCLASLSVFALAQQQTSATSAIASNTKPVANTTDDVKEKMVYRIGAGDVLDIRIFPRTQLSIQARVAENGYIRLLMIDQPVMAACKTETELALEIAELYKKYQRNPSVSVFIMEYNAIRVGVVGSVEHPSQFLLKRPMRLLDVISNAGGPNKEAGNRVIVAHTGAVSICERQTQSSDPDDVRFTEYSWRKIQEGDPASNPYLKPGDIVTIPRAEEVFVVGNVVKPQSVIMREPLTLRQAIAAAGGDLKTTKKNKVKVIRQTPGSTQPVEFIYDLVAIDKGKIPDPYLQANDIVTVPEDSWKAARKKIIDAFTQGLQSLPIVVR